MSEFASFRNHLRFLAAHRASVRAVPGAYLVEGDRPEFTFAILTEATYDPAILSRFKSVYAMSWVAGLKAELERQGFKPTGGVTYMSLAADSASWPASAEFEVRRAQTQSELEDFSETQCRGFLEKPEVYDVWKPILRAANDRNLADPEQFFFVGYRGSRPVGTTLVVRDADSLGIYAVATPPGQRKQGVGTTVMREGLHLARRSPADRVVLQVARGSYAETLYRKLGFVEDAHAVIYSR